MAASFSDSDTIRSDRTLVSCYQVFQKRRICVRRTKELDAGVNSNGVIDFVAMIIMLILIYDNIFGDQHREDIHDQTCKDFLYHAILFLWMKSNKTNMIFQFSEWGFNTPANFVDILDIICRKLIILEIGNKSFIIIFRYLDPYDPEFQRIGIFWAFQKNVKSWKWCKIMVDFRSRLNFICLSSC